MRIIAVMSPKGGIGKTTTSDSIAYMLGEEQGKRVLVLDGDPQGDTSKTFGVFEPDGIGMSELLEKHECVGGTYKTGDLIRPTEYSHVDIIHFDSCSIYLYSRDDICVFADGFRTVDTD